MPNEPDKKMDDLLKAYAQKRRADAGGSLELHPATRRVLQAEAAKLRPKPEAKRESWFSAWCVGWSRLGWSLGVIAVVGVGVWILVTNLRQREELAFAAKSETVATRQSVVPKGESQLQELDTAQPRREGMVAERVLEEQPKKVALAEGEAVELRSRAKLPTSSDEFKKASSPDDGAAARVGAAAESARVAASGARPATQKPAPRPALRTDAGQRSLELNVTQSPASTELAKNRDASADISLGTQVLLADKPQAPSLAAAQVNADPALAKSFGGETGIYVSLGNFTNAAVADDGVAGHAPESRDLAISATTANELAKAPLPISPSAAPAQSGPVADAAENEKRLRRQSGQQNVSLPGKDAAGTKLDAYSGNAPQSQLRNSQIGQERNVNLAQSYERLGRATDAKENTLAADTGRTDSSARFYYDYNQRGAPATILSNFDVEQLGDRVRVVDGDGSVYHGNILPGNAPGTARFGEQGYAVPTDTNQRSKANQAAEKNEGVAVVGVGFQVTGTNRTSKMPVSFDGFFWKGNVGYAPTSNADGSVIGRNNSAAAAGAVTNTAQSLAVRRIVGRARVGSTNEIRIDAGRSLR